MKASHGSFLLFFTGNKRKNGIPAKNKNFLFLFRNKDLFIVSILKKRTKTRFFLLSLNLVLFCLSHTFFLIFLLAFMQDRDQQEDQEKNEHEEQDK